MIMASISILGVGVIFTSFGFTCNRDTRTHWKRNNCVKVEPLHMKGYYGFFFFSLWQFVCCSQK